MAAPVPARNPARWGWHELDSRWAERLVRSAEIRPGDLVLDVGAGCGAITAPLVAAGAVVIAVELHEGRADQLRARFRGQPVKVVRADAADLRLPTRPFKVVSNPPFSVATAVLRRLTHPGSRLVAGSLVVPTWMAARWAGARGHFAIGVGPPVPKHAFRPPPPSRTSVVLLRRT